MRKLPDDYLISQRRIIEKKFKRKFRIINRKRNPNTHIRRISGYRIVTVPKNFLLLPHCVDEVIQFVKGIGESISSGDKQMLDFSSTDTISALGAVYLYSELDHADLKVSPVRIQKIRKLQVKRALQSTGIFKLCEYPSIPTIPEDFPIIKGKDDDKLRDITKYLMEDALLGRQLSMQNHDYAENLVSKAISEAMLNVKQHAYPDADSDHFWWFIGRIIGNELHIVLCDRGAGIPKTIASKQWFKGIFTGMGSETDDHQKIKAAMEYTRSSRKRLGSGLGSRDIQNLVLDAKKGKLTIVSGKGYYSLQGEQQNEESYKIAYDIGGTFIQWRIPLHPERGGNYE